MNRRRIRTAGRGKGLKMREEGEESLAKGEERGGGGERMHRDG